MRCVCFLLRATLPLSLTAQHADLIVHSAKVVVSIA